MRVFCQPNHFGFSMEVMTSQTAKRFLETHHLGRLRGLESILRRVKSQDLVSRVSRPLRVNMTQKGEYWGSFGRDLRPAAAQSTLSPRLSEDKVKELCRVYQ